MTTLTYDLCAKCRRPLAGQSSTCRGCGWNPLTGRRQCVACDGPTKRAPAVWVARTCGVLLFVSVITSTVALRFLFGVDSFVTRMTAFVAMMLGTFGLSAILAAATTRLTCDACARPVSDIALTTGERDAASTNRLVLGAVGGALVVGSIVFAFVFASRLV